MAQRAEQQADRHQHAGRVDEEDRDERARPVHVGDQPADDAAEADAEVDQGEVDAEVRVRRGPDTTAAIIALKPGQPTPS